MPPTSPDSPLTKPKESTLRILGKRLRLARIDAELRIEQVATTLDCSERQITRWENGQNAPSALHLRGLARLYKVCTNYLLGLAQHSTDLPGGMVIDEDAVETILQAHSLKDIEDYHEEGYGWGFEIPRRAKLVTVKTYLKLRDRIAKKIKKLPLKSRK